MGKKISRKNLGSIYTYYYPIYFKTASTSYMKSGVFGRKIKVYLNLGNQKTLDEFKKYKLQKKLSYVLLGTTVASLTCWTYKSLLYIDKSGEYSPRGFFRKASLGYLGLYFISFSSSIYLNLQGDKHLKNAVRYHNISIKKHL